jgi:hypothetical protein
MGVGTAALAARKDNEETGPSTRSVQRERLVRRKLGARYGKRIAHFRARSQSTKVSLP